MCLLCTFHCGKHHTYKKWNQQYSEPHCQQFSWLILIYLLLLSLSSHPRLPKFFLGKFQVEIVLYHWISFQPLSSFRAPFPGKPFDHPHLSHVSHYPINHFCPSVFHCTLTSTSRSFPKLFHAYKPLFPPAFYTSTQSSRFELFWLDYFI